MSGGKLAAVATHARKLTRYVIGSFSRPLGGGSHAARHGWRGWLARLSGLGSGGDTP